jgi:type IV pilus assembly protein PilE
MKQQVGFTLIELLVSVAIVGVLAGIAYPSYVDATRKSHRADAVADLNDFAQRLQRCFTTNSTFLDTSGATNERRCAVQITLRNADGVLSEHGYYRIRGANFTATTYILTAETEPGSSQRGDNLCRSFTIDQSGRRTALNSLGVDSPTCW